jgi:hypothetical protein
MVRVCPKILISLLVGLLLLAACGGGMTDDEVEVLEVQCNSYGGFNCKGLVMELSNWGCSLDEGLLIMERMFVGRMWAEDAAVGIDCAN